MRLKKVEDELFSVSHRMDGDGHRAGLGKMCAGVDGPRFTLLCSHVLVNCSSPLVFLICKVVTTACVSL